MSSLNYLRLKTPSKIKLFFIITLVCALLSAAIQSSKAQAENLDFTFGNGGKVVTDFTGGFDVANAMLIQADGKIIAAGSVANTNTNGTDYGLARFKIDGSLDSSFGVNGRVITDIGGLGDTISAIALQPDGKIVAAGFSFTENIFDFSLARYNSNGTLDTSFGNGGKVITDFRNNDDEAFAIVIQSDGKIVVAGFSADSNFDLDFALARYNANGSLDNSFGTGGKVITDFSGSDDQAFAMVLQTDGKLVIGGGAINPQTSESEFALARYDATGALDNSFGNGGKTATAFDEASLLSSLALLPDGKFIAAGEALAETAAANRPLHGEVTRDFALVKYNSDGTIDEQFGEAGKVTTDILGEDDSINEIILQADGKVIAVGSAVSSHRENAVTGNKTAATLRGKRPNAPTDGELDPSVFALARYNADGSLDASFGVAGKVTAEIAPDINIAFAAALQTDGRIVAAGRAGNLEAPDFGLARFITTGFDICLQDEQTHSVLQFNSATGDYQFQNCAKAITLSGRGTISINGCKITLTDSGANPKKPDRSVQVLVNVCTKTASASVFIFAPSWRSEINDLDIGDNSCACR
jgi:uncharacterized delta-60 repeat protein